MGRIKTTDEIVKEANEQLHQAELQKKKVIEEYKGEQKVPMYLSPMYQAHFGNVMQVSINGVAIFFKVDGSTQMIPQTFADEITSRRIQIDNILTKQSRMANIPQNFESSPGELNLF